MKTSIKSSGWSPTSWSTPGRFGLRGLTPFFDIDGDGGEGDGGGDGGDGGEGGGGEAQVAFEAKDENALIRIPGFDKPISVKDLREAQQARGTYEGTSKIMQQIATALQKRTGGQGQPGQGQRGQQPPRGQGGQGGGGNDGRAQDAVQEMLASLEANELPSGRELAQLIKAVENTRFAPIMRVLQGMATQMKELTGHVQQTRQERAEQDFGVDLGKTVASLKLPEGMEGGHTVATELARNLFFSYDEADHAKLRAGEFDKLFGEHFKQTRTYFRNLEKAELKAAQERQRQQRFVRPGSNTSQNGKPRKVQSNRDIAAALFAGDTPT